MTYLITGSSGLIGRNLYKYLEREGHTVWGIDVRPCPEQKNHINQDVRFWFDLLPYIPALSGIFNLACDASPKIYQRDPIYTLDTNIEGMKHALRLAKIYQCPIVQASTSEVYGDPTITPQPETYRGNVNCFGPRSCYDEGKRAAETMCWAWRQTYGVDVKVARIFNTYGPGMRDGDGRVVSNFIEQALENKPLTIYGDGQQTRSLMYIDDLLRGLVALMESNIEEPVNLGNPERITINELSSLILELIPESESGRVYEDFPPDDPRVRKPNIDKARRELEWTPRIGLHEGLGRTISWFKEKKSSPSYQSGEDGRIT